jgi:hypothetical protein
MKIHGFLWKNTKKTQKRKSLEMLLIHAFSRLFMRGDSRI